MKKTGGEKKAGNNIADYWEGGREKGRKEGRKEERKDRMRWNRMKVFPQDILLAAPLYILVRLPLYHEEICLCTCCR